MGVVGMRTGSDEAGARVVCEQIESMSGHEVDAWRAVGRLKRGESMMFGLTVIVPSYISMAKRKTLAQP